MNGNGIFNIIIHISCAITDIQLYLPTAGFFNSWATETLQRYYINNNSILLFDKQWKPSSCASQCSEGVRQLHILREDRDDELLQQAVNQSAVQPFVLEHFKYSGHAKLCGVSTNDSAQVICKGSVECEQVCVVCVCLCIVCCVYVRICSHV